MKVLVSGSTSQHVNPESNRRSRTFFGLLSEHFSTVEGAEVVRRGCSVHDRADTYSEFDKVIIGVAPFQALGANRSYGALAAIEALWGSDKLVLAVDQPDPSLVTRGLRSTLANRSAVIKPFYRYRSEYEDVATDAGVLERLIAGMTALLEDEWPSTLVPVTPWGDLTAVRTALPAGASGALVPTNVDGTLIKEIRAEGRAPLPVPAGAGWSHEKHADNKWLQALNLSREKTELPVNHRIVVEGQVRDQLSASLGFLHAPVGGEWWWTPRVATSLALGTPVFTDWQQASLVSDAFSVFPSQLEASDPRWAIDARKLAADQLDAYAQAIPGANELGSL